MKNVVTQLVVLLFAPEVDLRYFRVTVSVSVRVKVRTRVRVRLWVYS